MYNLPGDFLMTYDSDLSEHSDSSDFDGSNSTINQRKKQKTYWKNFRPKSKKDTNTPTCSSSYTVTQNSSREIWETQTFSQNGGTVGVKVRKTYKNKTCKTLDGGDQVETIKSKRASTRRKVIPCLSCMFGRSSNNVKQMSIIRENPTENVNIDTGCQATNVNGEHKIRKFNRSQQLYAVQPVYAVEGNAHAESSPFQQTKIVNKPLASRKTVRNEKSNAWCFTSSSEDNEYRFVQRETYKKQVEKPSKNRQKINTDVKQEYNRETEGPKRQKNAEQQYSTKVNRNYEVYTYPCLNRSNTGSAYAGTNTTCPKNELPITCSGFWEYFFTKLNSQQSQNQSNTASRPCKCRTESSSNVCKPCDKSLCTGDLSQSSQTGANKKGTCDCSTAFSRSASMQAPPNEIPCKAEPKNTQDPPRPKLKPGEKVYCKCYPEKKKPQPASTKDGAPKECKAYTNADSGEANEGTRPCQLSHTDITESLSQKYNGEILCIHNPPCVLINGCLNLPPAKEEVTMDTWPTNTPQTYKFCTSPRSTYFQKQPSTQFRVQTSQRNPYYLNNDSSCQYSSPIIGIQSTNKWKSNEGFQYQNSSIVKPVSVTDGSCQYRPSFYELQNHKTSVNGIIDENSRKYRISSDEIQKLKVVNESCQYWLSPTEMEKGQNDNVESCFYCRESPTDINKLITHSKDKLRASGIEFRVPKIRKEKIIQSICNHNPPCEVVRTCCTATYDPKIHTSCVHVPMCEKVPLCVLELKNQNEAFQACQHRPKCVEVPICTRNYIVLTAREEVATQSQSKCKMVCRHEPPCVMIQRCLARVCDSCIPCDAIPACVHLPMCEMIPACCRKSAKEMVSVHTQYPNQCSLV